MSSTSGERWKKYKKDHPLYMKRQKDLEKARHDARMALAREHVEEYWHLYNRFKKERGL